MNKPRILIVDDKEDNLYFLRTVLECAGYDVDDAHHGTEALEKARQAIPLLVVSDILMPVMDGFTLCRQWMKDDQLRTIPFVFYTATYTDQRDREFALSLGAAEFIVKPQEPELLLAQLQQILRSRENMLPPPSATPAAAPPEDGVFLQQYNETLVRKLEAKMEQLEQDIATRRRIEEQLRQSEERFRSFVENANDIVYSLSTDGVFTYVSPNWKESLGHDPSEVIGHSFEEFVHPDDVPVCRSAMLNAMAGHKQSGIEYRIRHLSGAWRWQMTNGVFASAPDGRPPCFLGIARDIHDFKQAEAERSRLQAQINMMQKIESVGRLAGGVAHDFNNMLQVILGHVELAMRHLPPDQPAHESLLEVRKAAERSADLTRQLLAFARKQTIAPKVLDLNEVVEGLLTLLRRLIGEHIELSWSPSPRLPSIKIDPSQIDQILTNLCANARDAMPRGGHITIETAPATLDAPYCANNPGALPGRYVMLSVRDQGSGMSKETLSKIFEPFFTTKEVGQGTGLGLATVYGIVKQNRGYIEATSQLGEGTRFRIFLPPFAEAEAPPPAPAASPAAASPSTPSSEKKTILLVEDEPAILSLGQIMLRRLGFDVIAARLPGEAIRLAQQHAGPIHLLISDVVMPEMDGRDLAKNLLSLHPDIKRLFMSGYTADVIAHHGVLDDGVHFLEKPFNLETLGAKIRTILGS